MEHINYLDLALGVIVVLSALIGLARGLVKEVLSLIAWAVSVYVAWRFADQVADDYVRQFIDDTLISYLAAFGALFLVTLFVVGLLNLVISQLLVSTGLSGFDRFLGMLFGLARGLLISTLLVFVLKLTPLVKEDWWLNSRLAPGFVGLGDWGWEKLPANIRQLLRESSDTVSEAGSQLVNVTDGIRMNDIKQGKIADRPKQTATGAQRNAISAMGDAEIRLESLSREQSQQNLPAKTPTLPSKNSATDQQNNEQDIPVLQLESVQ